METQGTTAKISVKSVNARLDAQEVRMEAIEVSTEKLSRRMESVQKSVDLLMQDREILEDIHATLVSLKDMIVQSRNHTENIVKDVKADIQDSSQETQNKVASLTDKVEETITGLLDRVTKKRTQTQVEPRKGFHWFVRREK